MVLCPGRAACMMRGLPGIFKDHKAQFRETPAPQGTRGQGAEGHGRLAAPAFERFQDKHREHWKSRGARQKSLATPSEGR